MKVNIITQPLFHNYGGILQNYALQEVLRRLGHEPLTINVPPRPIKKKANWKAYVRTGINLISKLRGDYYAPFLNPHTLSLKQRELSFPQREFIKKYINKNDVDAPFTSKTYLENPADLWIVGSDQVWRPWCNLYIENEFFDFLNDDIDRIAYAASFGTDQWEIPEEKTPCVMELAKKFKAISVREESGVKLCEDYLNIKAKHVLDPTMLLVADDYLKLTTEKDHPVGEYIATYILDPDKEKGKIIKGLSSKKNLTVHKIGRMHKDRFDSIESWLATIANAECIITDSFHGTVFSILFNRPVKILGNNTRGNSRLGSLISSLNLTPNSGGFLELNEGNFKKLNRLRDDSINFLKSSLFQNG